MPAREGLAVFVLGFTEFCLGEKLATLKRRVAWIDDDVVLVVDDALKMTGAHVEHEADARGHALVEPDVRHRHGQLDVAHALATDAGEGHLDAATVTDDALVLDALVLSAGTLPVLGRTEDTLTEKATLLGLERPVVDRLRVLDLAAAPGTDRISERPR